MARILRKLRVDFGSLVDVPANQHAHVLLFKRQDTEKRDYSTEERRRMADTGQALPDGGFPIRTEQDLRNAIQAIGRAKNPAAAKAHIIRRARALGCTDLLPEEWMTKMNDEKTESAEDITKRLADLEKRAKDAEDRATAAEAKQEEAITLAKAERDARLSAEYVRKAEAFGNLAVAPTVLGPILRKLHEVCSAEEEAEVVKVLTAANTAAAPAFREIGRSGMDAGNTATERLDTMARALITEQKASDYADAITQITKNRDNAELLKAYRAEQLQRN